MRIDDLPRSDRIEDRRGGGAAGFPTGRAGGLGLGTIIIIFALGWALGINPLELIGLLTGQHGSPEQSEPAPPNSRTEAPSDQTGQFVSAVLGSTEVQWKEIFAQAGKTTLRNSASGATPGYKG
jgi:predicted metalloprotease